MSRLHPYRIPATPLARATIWAAGCYGVAAGLLIAAGGLRRMSGPAYEVIRTVHPYVWGAVAVSFGVAILVGSASRSWWVKLVGLLGLSAWSTALALGVAGAAVLVPTAGLVGAPTFLYVACSLAILTWVDEREPG